MLDLPLSAMVCRLPGGRAGSSLTGALDLHSVARHPVARWDLPAPATRRVSCGPKNRRANKAVVAGVRKRKHRTLTKEGFKGRVATYIERIQFRREAPWTRSARTARVSI